MPEPVQVFHAHFLLQATEQEPAELWTSIVTILAVDQEAAEDHAARMVPPDLPASQADRMEIIVRLF